MITWDQLREDFEPDGALRDVYIIGADIDTWRSAVQVVRDNWDTEFTIDGSPATLPMDVAEVFDARRDHGPLLQVRLRRDAVLNCHFFSTDVVEFDLDPRDFGSDNVRLLQDFILALGRAVQKPVLLTHENMLEAVILRYQPATDDLIFVPAPASN